MSLKLSSLPEEGVVQTPSPAVTVAPKQEAIPGKRRRRTRLEIALEKQAQGKELSETDLKALEKANVKQPVQNQEVEAHQSGEDSNSDGGDSTPPWEESETSPSTGETETQSAVAETLGATGAVSLPTKESETTALGQVGNFFNISGGKYQLVFKNHNTLVFIKADD